MKRFLIALIVLLAVTCVIAGCGQPTAPAATTAPKTAATAPAASPSTPQPKYGGTMRWIEGAGPTTPIGYTAEIAGPSGVTPIISLQVLLKEYLNGSLGPYLASSYEVNTSKDNPSITFHLQKGVKFHDGSDFNAQAVKWNYEEIKKMPANAGNTSNWKSVDAIDDLTLRISLKEWDNTVTRSFADSWGYLASPTAFQSKGIEWARYNMVGTGPFTQTGFQRDVTLTGAKNPNYWEKGKPYLDKFEYVFVTDEMTRQAQFKSGGADVVNISYNGRIANELKAAGYGIASQLGGPQVLLPDSTNADSPWSNLKVRQAAEYAIDKENIASAFGFGYWKTAYQFSTPDRMSYDPAIPGRKYDVAKAKQLLAEAGFPNGFKTTIIAGPLFLQRDTILAIQSQFAAIGIQADVQFPDMAKWTEISNNPWKGAVLYSNITESGNPNKAFVYFMGVPAIRWKSVIRPEGWAELLNASKITAEPDPVLLKKMENIIYDNALCLPVYAGSILWAYDKKVQDHGMGTRGQSNWYEPQNIWFK